MTTTESRPLTQSGRAPTNSDYNGRPVRQAKGRIRTPPPVQSKIATEQQTKPTEFEDILGAKIEIKKHARNDDEKRMFVSMLLG